ALADDRRTRTSTLVFTKGARDRAVEETVVGGLVLNLLAEEFGIAERVELPLQSGESVSTTAEPTQDAVNAVLDGDVAAACQEIDGRLRIDAAPPTALLCGSFNPLHAGHLRLAEVAALRLGRPVAFELGAVNADKPAFDAAEARRRLR